MITQQSLEELLKRSENRYTLAIAVARRARQLIDGAQPLVDRTSVGSNNIVSVAAEEVGEDKVAVIPGIHDAYIPLRRDVREKLLEAEREAEAQMLGLSESPNPNRPSLTEQEIADIKERGRANVIQHLSPEEADFDIPEVESQAGEQPASPLAYELLEAVERLGGYDAVTDDEIDFDDIDLDHIDDFRSDEDEEYSDYDEDEGEADDEEAAAIAETVEDDEDEDEDEDGADLDE